MQKTTISLIFVFSQFFLMGYADAESKAYKCQSSEVPHNELSTINVAILGKGLTFSRVDTQNVVIVNEEFNYSPIGQFDTESGLNKKGDLVFFNSIITDVFEDLKTAKSIEIESYGENDEKFTSYNFTASYVGGYLLQGRRIFRDYYFSGRLFIQSRNHFKKNGGSPAAMYISMTDDLGMTKISYNCYKQ